MKAIPSTPERCRLLLAQWRKDLALSSLETNHLTGELKSLDSQLNRLIHKRLRIAVFGRVGVGKSSLLNALLKQKVFATDVAHGCTRHIQAEVWNQPIEPLRTVDLVDTPGIDEIAARARERLAKRIALQADLVLLVLDSDLTSIELEALKGLLESGKPIVIVLNRCDQWSASECSELIKSIRNRLPPEASNLEIKVVAAAPRQREVQINGKVRSNPCPPIIEPLRDYLTTFLSTQGELLLAMNALRQADCFYHSLKSGRLKRSKKAAQGLIGRFAALKASGVAANPLLMLDLAGGLACDTALVMQLSDLYGLRMGGRAARQLLKRVSVYNAFLGGAQLGIQFALGILRQILLLAAPISHGLSLAPAAPVALAQAALAVHTTKLTGRLAARELLKGTQRRELQPSAMLRRLANSDPIVKTLIGDWPQSIQKEPSQVQTFLP